MDFKALIKCKIRVWCMKWQLNSICTIKFPYYCPMEKLKMYFPKYALIYFQKDTWHRCFHIKSIIMITKVHENIQLNKPLNGNKLVNILLSSTCVFHDTLVPTVEQPVKKLLVAQLMFRKLAAK